MDLETIKTVAAIMGSVGVVYGLYNARKLREIEKRGKAPYFVFRNLQVDCNMECNITTGDIYHVYPTELRTMAEPLFNMSNEVKNIPDDYPDGRIVGMVLENKGSGIHSFTTKCKEEYIFQRYKEQNILQKKDSDANCYEFRYRFSKSDLGKPLKFKIWFEVESGFRGNQTWQIEKGNATIKRVTPKGV